MQGQVLLILSGWQTQFARFMGKALITDDGEAIEGDAAEEAEVMRRVTHFINSTDAAISPEAALARFRHMYDRKIPKIGNKYFYICIENFVYYVFTNVNLENLIKTTQVAYF